MIVLGVTPECCYFKILIDTHIGKMKYGKKREQWVLGNMTLAIKAVRGKRM
jgi:hypothetical protein